MKKLAAILILVVSHITSAIGSMTEDGLRDGFVYLHKIDPSIKVHLKYHKNDNFTGKAIEGCKSGRAVLTAEAAEALRNVQEDLVMYGFSIVVYNAYHPEKAYRQLDRWLNTPEKESSHKEYYPNIKKTDLARAGYIKAKHKHTRGSTVDVTIISLKDKLRIPGVKHKRSYKGNKNMIYMDDGSLDMGTSHDLFDSLSAYSNNSVPDTAIEHRKMLREAMQNHGFIPNDKMWWQFTLVREPYADSRFNFDI